MKIIHCDEQAEFEAAENFLNTQHVPNPPAELQFRFPLGLKAYLDHFSKDHDTWILKSEKEVVCAGSLIYRRMRIEGAEQNVAMTSFMKIKPDAKSTLLWAKHLLPAINQRLEEKHCNYIFSFVFHSLRNQIRSFRQAVKLKDTMPRYFLIRKTSFILIQGRLPWLSRALKSVTIRQAKVTDVPAILDFILTLQSSKKITKIWTEEGLTSQISNNESKSDREQLYICEDYSKKVLGWFLPEETEKFREDIVASASPETMSYFQLQKLLSIFGITSRPPKFGLPIKMLYLSNIDATNPDVFESMLRFAYKSLKLKHEIISYTHFSGNLISRPPSSFIVGAFPMDLYLILPKDKKPPEFLKSYWMAPTPDLESIVF